jgi:CBS domain containing-hemolysin-like protein
MELPFAVSIFLLLLLLYWGAWISSSETALFSISSHTLKTYQTHTDPKKQLIAQLLSHPRDLLVTVFMINTFTNIVFQNVASDMFGEHAGWSLKVGVPLILTLVLGEIIPKYIGLQNNLSIAYRVAPAIDFLQSSLSWVRKWIIAITTPISRVMFFFLKKEPAISREEIEHVLATSQKHGVLQQEETELLAGFLNLQESQVKELMLPKEDILYYDLSQPLSKLIYLFDEEAITRIPVCDQSLENVLGVITAMEFFHHQSEIASPKDLIPYLFKPFYVPETTLARLLLKRMDEQEHVLAFVVNEYGSLSGLISREDLIEVVVGLIEETEEPQLFIPAGKSEVIASGKWELSEFNDYFNVDLKSQFKAVTIGGWLIEKIGEIPKSGSKYELEGFLFHVLAASSTRITRLFIRKLLKPST